MTQSRFSGGPLDAEYAISIVETVREPLLVLDGELRTRLVNAAFCRTFQVTREESLDRPVFELGNGQWDMPALRTLLTAVLPERRTVEDYEVAHEFEHIGRRVMLLNARELAAAKRKERLILVAIEDVTERRRAEVALAWHSREIQRSNRELEEFAYVASHDLQEPLRKIQAFADLLSTDCADALGPTGLDYLNRMVDASRRMQALITDLLALSRVTTGRRSLVPVDLGAIVREVLTDLELALRDAGGRVEVGPLPTVAGDRVHMTRLFQNLISNAIKFRRTDTPPLIRIDATRVPRPGGGQDGAVHEIHVRDNGIGFDQRHADLIFMPFQRLHPRGAFPGTGIGLTICRKIVERHGGTLATTSAPGVGSSFVITLPEKQPLGD